MELFDLSRYLWVYVVGVGLVIALVLRVIRRLEPWQVPPLGAIDPRLVAYLSGGPSEALRIARSLVAVDARPLTREAGRVEVRAIERELLGLGLIATLAQRVRRAITGAGVWLLAWAVVWRQLGHALRTNDIPLLITALIVPCALATLLGSRRTPAGTRLLRELRKLGSASPRVVNASRPALPQSTTTLNELSLPLAVYSVSVVSGTSLTQTQPTDEEVVVFENNPSAY